MSKPTERDMERAKALWEYLESFTYGKGRNPADYIAQALADERAWNVEKLRALAPAADDMHSGARRQGWLMAADELEAAAVPEDWE